MPDDLARDDDLTDDLAIAADEQASPRWTAIPDPTDPAELAAVVLFTLALRRARVTPKQLGKPSTVTIVLLPSAIWYDPVAATWRRMVANGDRPIREGFERCSSTPWALWEGTREPRSGRSTDGDGFASAIACERVCVGIYSNLRWLPPDLVAAADYRLVIPAMTPSILSVFLTRRFGGRPARVRPDVAVAVTPRLLRLAHRPDQTARSYATKLTQLTEVDLADAAATASAKGTSPREEPTLDNLHGLDEAVAWGRAVVRDVAAWRDGRISWNAIDRGCLLSGPPGCGKTLFARALATSAGATLVTGSYGRWHGSGNAHQGDLLKAMAKTFAEAREKAPSILFIDEVDSFPNRATITHHYAEWEIQVVNALLAEIDGVEQREGVILVAACNMPDKLDPALLRSGRLDRHLSITLPDRTALAAILREHLGPDLGGESLSMLAGMAIGSNGADCERFVRGARRRAREAGRAMRPDDLLLEITAGTTDIPEMRQVLAVHEAGHAVVSETDSPGSVEAVSIRASGSAAGLTSIAAKAKSPSGATRAHAALMMLLAGRAAEEELLGAVTGGAGGDQNSDLGRATILAVALSTSFGLDAENGLLWMAPPAGPEITTLLLADRALAARVRAHLDLAYSDVRRTIRQRLSAVQAVADALVVGTVLAGSEVREIIQRHPAGEDAS